MKLKISGALFHCGRCRKTYSNPFGHVCVTRLDKAPRTGRARFAPTLTASAGNCPACGKPRGNPLTHTCAPRSDFKQRQRAAKKKARPVHRYEACRDADCQRQACTAYKQGREEGYRDGDEDGYARGFPDGIAACPRTHK